MTYADSLLRCARSDIPATRGWWSGNAWISVNACSGRLSRLRPEWPTLNQPCDGTRAAKWATMVRVGHVRQNLMRERVSGFGRLVVAKIDRAFGRAGRALRRAHRESAPDCSGGARGPVAGAVEVVVSHVPGLAGQDASAAAPADRPARLDDRYPAGVFLLVCPAVPGGGCASGHLVSPRRAGELRATSLPWRGSKPPVCFRIGYPCRRRRPAPCVRRAVAILPLNARRHVGDDDLIKPLMPIVWRPMLVNRNLGGRKRRRVG